MVAHHIFTPALALAASALAFSTPASAQLLGGSGGLGGGLGGSLGGTLGSTLGNPTGPLGGTLGRAGAITGSVRGDAPDDRRPRRVQSTGSAPATGPGSATANADLPSRTRPTTLEWGTRFYIRVIHCVRRT